MHDQERSFLAGFLEGEASFVVQELNGGQSFSCLMVLKQRDDSQDAMERLLVATGLGRLYRVPARSTSKPQIAWVITTQDHCRRLLTLIETGFHGRRSAELMLWSQAVRAWTDESGETRRTAMRRLTAELAGARRFGGGAPSATPFAGRDELLGYISGFLSAEGCLGFSNGRPRSTVHLRQDDKPLLELLASATGLGSVTEHRPQRPLNPSAMWTITARADLAQLVELLLQGGLAGRKLRELKAWRRAVDELNRPSPRREVIAAARDRLAEVRAYKPSTRTALLRLPGRDLRQESLVALKSWSRGTTGGLSCTAYMLWRREHTGVPGRNTIVRQFGSWQAALEAAGLGDRLARAPRPIGGEAGRSMRRELQRQRVIAAVQTYRREHGRLPRAMEFFRWRYEKDVDAPSQGTVYRVFPGGWDEVLDELRVLPVAA
jgi:hypothetical protein